MTHRIPLIDGDEYDALTQAKQWYRWRPGQRARTKRRYNKRLRQAQRRADATEPRS